MSLSKWSRCDECGRLLQFERPCVMHPGAGRLEWGPKMRIAYDYVCRAARAGLVGDELDLWIETGDEREQTGASVGDLALCLALARKWQMADFDESGLRPVATPKGLFG